MAVVFRNNFLNVYKSHDTGGLLFPHAIRQLYAGVILFQMTVLGIFICRFDRHCPDKHGEILKAN